MIRPTEAAILAAIRENLAAKPGGGLTQKQLAAKLGCSIGRVRRLEKQARLEAWQAARLPLGRWVDEASAAIETLRRLHAEMQDREGFDGPEDAQAQQILAQGLCAVEGGALAWVRREACRRGDGPTLARLANRIALAGVFQPSPPESPGPRGGGLFSVTGGQRGEA